MNLNKKNRKAHQTLLMIGMFSIVMLFAGLTSAYIVSKGSFGDEWDDIVLPNMFYISTGMICISSFFGYASVRYSHTDNFKMITRSLLLTILFGLFFFLFQILGWKELVNQGKFLSGNNLASSYLYVLTLTHLAHLIGGITSLCVVLFYSIKKYYHSDNSNGLTLAIRFWHFLAILWLYLLLFLVFVN